MRKITIATRKSPLALWQANYVRSSLAALYPEMEFELLELSTMGDEILDSPLSKIGGKGLFVKALEIAMMDGRADLAVHSMKDVPMALPQELFISTICKRESPYDAFVSNKYTAIEHLPEGAIVGTSSLRRQTQIKLLRADLVIKDLRGNVGTRLAKLDAGNYDAIILASAGLKRLKLENRIACSIPSTQMLPAVGQGAVGIEIRKDDAELEKLLLPLECTTTTARVKAERAMNAKLNGGCQMPVAGFSEVKVDRLWIRGLVANIEGSKFIKKELTGDINHPQKLGELLANELIASGALELLATMND